MIVNDFNGFWASIRPEEAQAELVVDADAVLTSAIATQGLQPVAWRDPQVVKAASDGPTPELMAPLADQPGEIGFCVFTKGKRVEVTLRESAQRAAHGAAAP